MEFKTLSLEDVEKVRLWREDIPFSLRTPRSLTKEQQENFYRDTICNRDANSYYWGIHTFDGLIGQAGIESIEWTNRRGEISLILDPNQCGKGLGTKALEMLLCKGFFELNLDNIFGECYKCNPNIGFWYLMVKKYEATTTATLPNTKYWGGQYYDSLFFNFRKNDF